MVEREIAKAFLNWADGHSDRVDPFYYNSGQLNTRAHSLPALSRDNLSLGAMDQFKDAMDSWKSGEREDGLKPHKWNQREEWGDDAGAGCRADVPEKQASMRPVDESPQSWEYAREVDRLLSLRHWAQLTRFNPSEFSREGFFQPKYAYTYPIKKDTVECFACGIRLYSWNSMVDTAYTEHKKHSPECPMVKQRINYQHNEPIGDDETRKLLLATIYKQ